MACSLGVLWFTWNTWALATGTPEPGGVVGARTDGGDALPCIVLYCFVLHFSLPVHGLGVEPWGLAVRYTISVWTVVSVVDIQHGL